MGTQIKRFDNIHAPLKTTFMKEVEVEDESGAKVNTLVFQRFQLIPPITEDDEANSSSLYNRIKAAGGETFRAWMEPEEGNCAVRILDLVKLWRCTHRDFDVPNDTYSSMYIYQCIHNESNNLPAPDLKPYLITPSVYESYDPNEILSRNVKWSDLKKVRELPSTPYKKIIADLKEGRIAANPTSTDPSKSKQKDSADAAVISSSAPPQRSANSSPGDALISEDSGRTLPRTENVIPPQVPSASTDAEKSTSPAKSRKNKDPPAPTDAEKSTLTAKSRKNKDPPANTDGEKSKSPAKSRKSKDPPALTDAEKSTSTARSRENKDPPAPTGAEKSKSPAKSRKNKEPPAPTDDDVSTSATSSSDTEDLDDDDDFTDTDSDSDIRISPSRTRASPEKNQNRRFFPSPRNTNAVKIKPPRLVPKAFAGPASKKPKISQQSKSTDPGGSATDGWVSCGTQQSDKGPSPSTSGGKQRRPSGNSDISSVPYTSDSDGSQNTPSTNAMRSRPQPYTVEEDNKIFTAIRDQNAFAYTKGNRLWQQFETALENNGHHPKRTWQGLQNRWRRYIFPAILKRERRFPVSDKVFAKLKKMSEERGTHDTICPKFHF